MNIDQLYVHDGTLKSVVDDVSARKLTFLVDLPEDEWSETYIPKRIIFSDALNYRVEEGPTLGDITILDIHVTGVMEHRRIFRMETTSGYREWKAIDFEVEDENKTG